MSLLSRYFNRRSVNQTLAHANAARDRGVWVLAAAQYKMVLAARPNDFDVWVQLGHVLKEAGNLRGALDAYAHANRLRPLDADLLLNLGHLHKVMGDRLRAIAYYRESFERDGNHHARDELSRMDGFVSV